MTSSIEHKQTQVEATMRLAPVIPVVIIDDVKAAVPMARALVAGGTPAIEVTLRTPAALDAIRAIAQEVEGAVVGVGTVLNAEHLAAAQDAPARASRCRPASRRSCSTRPTTATCRCCPVPPPPAR